MTKIEIQNLTYTKEQYQRCLSAASKMANAILKMKQGVLTPQILTELYKSEDEYRKITLEVVNESYLQNEFKSNDLLL